MVNSKTPLPTAAREHYKLPFCIALCTEELVDLPVVEEQGLVLVFDEVGESQKSLNRRGLRLRDKSI